MDKDVSPFAYRRKKSFTKSTGLPNYAVRILEKKDTLDSISVCSSVSCSSGYLSDTSTCQETSFDDADDKWEVEMQSRVARAVRDLEIKSWRRRLANKKRMSRRTSVETPSIVITEDVENEKTTADSYPGDKCDDPGQWIEWGDLLKGRRVEGHSFLPPYITSISEDQSQNYSDTESTKTIETTQDYNVNHETTSVENSSPPKCFDENETLKVDTLSEALLKEHNEKPNSTVKLEVTDTQDEMTVALQHQPNHNKGDISAKRERPGPRSSTPNGRLPESNLDKSNSTNDQLEKLFDALGSFSDEESKSFGNTNRRNNLQPKSSGSSTTGMSEAGFMAFEDLLRIDEKSQCISKELTTEDRGVRKDGDVIRSARRFDSFSRQNSLTSRWRGKGYQTTDVNLRADRGHLIWTKPRGTLELVLGDGNKRREFKCFVDPQNSGMKLSYLNPETGKLEVVLNGEENPRCSANQRRLSSQPGLREHYFRFESCEGHVRLLLDPLIDSKWDFFKLNYTIIS